MSDYRAPALVCANGHLLTGDTKANLGDIHKFCPRCGVEALDACPSCGGIIPGDHYSEESWTGQLEVGERIVAAPRFCGLCGKPFPWAASALEAARQLIEEFQLDAADKAELAGSLPELVNESPKTQVAIAKWSRILKKAGGGTANALRDVLINVLSEAVNKAIWGR